MRWTRSGPQATIADSTLASTAVTLTGDATITALFTINRYTLDVQNNGNGSTIPSGTDSVDHGVPVSIRAAANTGYHFVKWTRSGPAAAIVDTSKDSTAVALTGNATVTALFAVNSYTLTMANDGGGTTTPSSSFQVPYGIPVNITAMPAAGNHFVSWTYSGGASVGNPATASTTVTLSDNATLTAHFAVNKYLLTLQNDGNGTTTPANTDSATHGVAVNISALPATGYNFVKWTKSGFVTIADSTSEATSVTLTGDGTVRATFTKDVYTLTMQSDGHGTTTPASSSPAVRGSPVYISATPLSGYHFVKWARSGPEVEFADSTAASTTATLTGNGTVTATFAINTYTLTMQNDGHGTTNPAGARAAAHLEVVTIGATPATGYHFVKWTRAGGAVLADSSSSLTTATVSGDAAVTATFTVNSYTLTVAAGSNGAVTPAGAVTLNHFDSTSVIASPETGHHFVRWVRSDTTVVMRDSLNDTTFVSLTGSGMVTAVFAINTYTLTLGSGGYGSATPSGAMAVNHGAATTISAMAFPGYHFVNWTRSDTAATIADSASASTTVALAADATVTANFGLNTYTLTMENDGNGTTSPSATGLASHGVAYAISATPVANYHFDRWTRATPTAVSIADSTLATTTAVLVGPATVSAHFTLNTYTLTVVSDAFGTAVPAGANVVNHGAVTGISAAPSTGYHFVKWTRSGAAATIADSTSASTTVTLSGNATVTAVHAINRYSLAMAVSGNGSGSTTPAGTTSVDHGAATAITATPAAGSYFVRWERSGTAAAIGDSTVAATTVSLTGNAAVTAVFTLYTYTLTVSNSGNGSTTPSGATTVNYGAATPIAAVPSTGYHFTNWTRSSTAATIADSTAASTTAALTGNATVTANFSINTYTLTVASAGNGTVSPSGLNSANHGAATAIIATPSTGYHFVKWTRSRTTATFGDSTLVSTTVTLTDSTTVTANFAINTYILTTAVNNTSYGTVTPSIPTAVNHGVATTIIATPATGYHFTSWTFTGGATVASTTSAATTTTLTDSGTVTANFMINTYVLTVTNTGNGSTSPSGAVAVQHGTARPIFAIPSTGYHFTNWDRSSAAASFADATLDNTTVTLTGNATIYANFAINTYSLTVTSNGNGTVTPSGTSTVNHGALTSITAIPTGSYSFWKWQRSGSALIGDSTLASTSVSVTGNATVIGYFAYKVDYTTSSGGFVATPATTPCWYESSTTLTITAQPSSGYVFDHWTTATPTTISFTDHNSSTTSASITGSGGIQAIFRYSR